MVSKFPEGVKPVRAKANQNGPQKARYCSVTLGAYERKTGGGSELRRKAQNICIAIQN
jgi:hypothetical protein